VCFFDKDRGAEILIRAMGGRYLAVENGKPTGFNPFQREPTESNILFLETLVEAQCAETL
jgi:type IV secretion system protein VirB4